MSLMSGLYVGSTGLRTSQNALNTTAHNLSNIETQGYVRQQTLLADMEYSTIGRASVSDKQIGIGVEYDQVRQVRDYFLDQAYRKEAGRSAFYEISYETTSEIETLLGEFDGVAFQESLGDLWTSIQELQKDPSSTVTEGAFINTAAQFVERAQAVYNGLCDYQDNLNSRVYNLVNRINELGDTICKLNEAIKKEELGEQQANDLRDRRNLAVDELSKLVRISYDTNADGDIEVMVEGTAFVTRDRYFKMGVAIDETSGFYTPVWPGNDNNEVFQRNQQIDTDHDTDIGELKSIVLARGDRRANYTDMNPDAYNKGKYTYYDTDTSTYVTKDVYATSGSVVMNVQAELDQMVHSIVTEINNIVTGEKYTIDAGGTPSYTSADELPRELFVRLGTSRYEESGGTYTYVAEDEYPSHADTDNLYTINNIKINPDLVKVPSLLANGFMTADRQVDSSKADAMAEAFDKTFSSLNPNLAQEYNYMDYYSAMVGQVATTGSVYSSIVMAQQVASQQLYDARDSIIGVSSNEELTNMIKFQNAYNASSRFINACNDMLEDLLNKLS